MTSAEYKKYVELVDIDIDQAKQFRHGLVPLTLYKFFSLSKSGRRKIDGCKLETLKNNQLRLSSSTEMNDPFECNGLYYDGVEDGIRAFKKSFNQSFYFTSFTDNYADNLSMWSYYANNSYGFCIQYSVLDADLLWDINYCTKRYSLNNCVKYVRQGRAQDSQMMLLFEAYLIKHTSWEHEREYRLIYPNPESTPGSGKCDLETVGLKIEKIYIGAAASRHTVKCLTEISDLINAKCVKLKMSDTSYEFVEEVATNDKA